METFHRMMEANRDKMELALTSSDVRRIVASGKTAVLLSIESGFDQEGDIDVLRLWHRLGVRLVQFAGQVTTAYADSAVRGEVKWGGINERGRRLIGAPGFRKTLFKLQLLPRWLTSSDFRLAFTSGVSANKVCFERELLEHYRLVFQKQR